MVTRAIVVLWNSWLDKVAKDEQIRHTCLKTARHTYILKEFPYFSNIFANTYSGLAEVMHEE